MACTIDHLSAGKRITVICAFDDTAGIHHPVGETGVLQFIECNLLRSTAVLQVERDDGTRFAIPVNLMARDAPGNGTMRRFFEVGEYELAPSDRERRAVEARTPRPLPELVPLPDNAGYRELMDHVIALAARRAFDRAGEVMWRINHLPGTGYESCNRADELEGFAVYYARPADSDVFEWIYDQAMDQWYQWAGRATSGGEGTALMMDVKAAQRRRDELRKRIASAAG